MCSFVVPKTGFEVSADGVAVATRFIVMVVPYGNGRDKGHCCMCTLMCAQLMAIAVMFAYML